MQSKDIQIKRPTALAIVLAMLVIGGVLGFLVPAWAGMKRPTQGQMVPMYFARPEAAPGPTVGPPSPMGFAPVVKPALPAVVNIATSRVIHRQNTPMFPFFNDPFFQQFFGGRMPQQQQPQTEREHALGSGVIVSPDGYILTNNHVIQGATDIKVSLSDKRQFTGKVIGADPKTDIAVVKINATNLPTLSLGDSTKLQVGDYVLAIGDPFGIGETVTMGIVSATGRNGLDIENYEDFIQTDAAINPGNSGGALIDARGQLIGINTAILAGGGGGNQGIGFAIPINMARYVMDQILKHGKVTRGYLGAEIQEVTPALAKAFNVPPEKGALISDVEADGPAAKAGLKKGEVIEAINGQPVTGINELRLQIAQTAPGTTVHLKIVEPNSQQQDVPVTLAQLPETQAKAGAPGQPGSEGLMKGVQVDNLTPDIARQIGVPASTKGVVVSDVAADSAAADAGLQRGDVIEEVNRQPVPNVSAYQRAVAAAGTNHAIVLLVNRQGTTAFIVVQPE